MRKIFVNGRIYTFNSIQPTVQSVVTENGFFIDMGDTDQMLSLWKTSDTEIIDLEGKSASPGLTDSHLHLSMVADSFVNLDLTGVRSKQGMLDKISEKAKTLAPGEWLTGGNWDENLFTDGTIPSIQELDDVAPDHPLLLHRICRHASVTNSNALRVSQYHADMHVPDGGTIVLDETTKEPTGLLLESASGIVSQHIPARSYDKWIDAMRQAIQYALSQGLTSVHTNDPLFLGGLQQTYQIYDQLLHGEALGLRANLLINHEFIDDLKENRMFAGLGSNTLKIGAIKLFADGAFGRRTALLSEPYSDDPGNVGDAMFDKEGLTDIVRRARELHFPVAIHAIGDQALETVLDVLDQFPSVALRDRIIHVPYVPERLLSRLKSPSRIADIQPRFLASDFPWVQDRLGEKRVNQSYAWKTLLDAGIICAGGSDAPVEPVSPLLGIHAAITRKTPGDDHTVYNPKEILTVTEAFKLFTEYAAYATNEETIKGTIARGKLADMTVYSTNPFEFEDPDQLLTLKIDKTIIGGEVKWDSDRN
ncbi:amidohydrolase [Oceanobacillus sp. CAU 1775]